MYLEEHGGGCCGITHIYDFWNTSERGVASLRKYINTFLDKTYLGAQGDGWELEDGCILTKRKFSCVLEACLTDQQMVFWAPIMKEIGFRIVNRFLNSNSGNCVNVLHYNPAGRRKLPPVPYKW